MDKFSYFLLGMLIGGLFGIGSLHFVMSEDPTAMDVYQGKTVLEYKVVEGEKVDSCVIWKSDRL